MGFVCLTKEQKITQIELNLEGPRAGLNQLARKEQWLMPREGRRRPWEPPQPRWGKAIEPRTSGESPVPAQKIKK